MFRLGDLKFKFEHFTAANWPVGEDRKHNTIYAERYVTRCFIRRVQTEGVRNPDVKGEWLVREVSEEIADGYSVMNPNDKQMSKFLGKKVALAHAMKTLKFEKKLRLEIWDAFFKFTKRSFTKAV